MSSLQDQSHHFILSFNVSSSFSHCQLNTSTFSNTAVPHITSAKPFANTCNTHTVYWTAGGTSKHTILTFSRETHVNIFCASNIYGAVDSCLYDYLRACAVHPSEISCSGSLDRRHSRAALHTYHSCTFAVQCNWM